jgi:hypothetical protein
MGRLCSCDVTVRHCCTTSSTSTMGRGCLYHTRPPCDSASGSVCAHTSVSAESTKKAPAHLIPSTFPHLTHFNYCDSQLFSTITLSPSHHSHGSLMPYTGGRTRTEESLSPCPWPYRAYIYTNHYHRIIVHRVWSA